MSQLHATLYGATFVAKMTKAISESTNKESTSPLNRSQNSVKQEESTTPLTESQNTVKQDSTTPLTESQNTAKQDSTTPLTESQNTESQNTESQKSKEPSKLALRIRSAMQGKNKITSNEPGSAENETVSEKKDS